MVPGYRVYHEAGYLGAFPITRTPYTLIRGSSSVWSPLLSPFFVQDMDIRSITPALTLRIQQIERAFNCEIYCGCHVTLLGGHEALAMN